jgi:hypothetical protein
MAKRVAVLMKLKDGLTVREAHELCELLRRLGDPAWLKTTEYESYENPVLGDRRIRRAPAQDRPKSDEEILHRYDDEYGDPVFYVP